MRWRRFRDLAAREREEATTLSRILDMACSRTMTLKAAGEL